jgi:NTP pyrophosphatase (non-canonical NTP hydrolase)
MAGTDPRKPAITNKRAVRPQWRTASIFIPIKSIVCAIMDSIEKLTNQIIKFRDARDWKQFHNAKDLALSLTLEAAEVLEHFQWKSKEEIEKYIKTNKTDIGEELADVLYWVLLMAHDLKIDIAKAVNDKMKQNAKKYPVSKSKGKHTKYNKL